MNPEPMFTTAELAKLLQVAEVTVQRRCKSGAIPAVKPGREWRIAAAVVRRLVAGLPAKEAPDA